MVSLSDVYPWAGLVAGLVLLGVILRRHLWIVRVAAGAVVTVLAALQVVPLPATLLAVTVGAVMVGILLWSELEHRQGEAAPEHVAEIRRLAEGLQQDVSAWQRARYSPDKHRAALYREQFKRHFREVKKRLDRWDRLLVQSQAAKDTIGARATKEADLVGELHPGLDTTVMMHTLRSVAEKQAAPNAPTAKLGQPLTHLPIDDKRIAIFSGGSGIAYVPRDTNPDEVESMKVAIEAAIERVPEWEELVTARAIERRIRSAHDELQADLTSIQARNRFPKKCDGC